MTDAPEGSAPTTTDTPTAGGAPAGPPSRGPARSRLLLLLVLAAVLVVAGTGAFVLLAKKDPRTNQARAAVDSYLSAWSAADYAGMSEHADKTAGELKYVLAPIRSSLQVKTQTFTRSGLTRKNNTATVPFKAAYDLAGVGAWDYDGQLTVDRGPDKVWRVAFVPTAIHPDLGAGGSLTRTAVPGTRGRLLDRNGTPLAGASADLDANLLGTVGTLTAEQAAALGPGFTAGAKGGQSGLERAYNAQLAGTPGATITATRSSTGAPVTLQTFPATNGKDLRTTLDLRYQRAAENGVATAGRTAALVSIDAKTGGVLAIANYPTGGASTAIRGQYPPGSTFKMVTATAGLLKGLDESSPLNCPASVFAGGRSFKNANKEAFGPIDLKQAFYHSCNTAFVNLRSQLTDADMQKAVDLYGFDGKQPLPITSFGGTYPTGPTHDQFAEAFGQDQIEASPLQMAAIPAAIAGGAWHRPFVVGPAKETHALPAGVATQLRDMMRAVVTTGTAAGISFPGEVSGKTGTAEYGTSPGPGKDPPTHAWFAGFRGNVAFACLVPGGGFGADVAGPPSAAFLRALDASGGP